MTQATTTITCTKSQFKAALEAKFLPVDHARFSGITLASVINGLVKWANEQRGTATGHNAYLDLDFTVYPDGEDPRNPATVHFTGVDDGTLCGMPSRVLDGAHHRSINYEDGDSTCASCNAQVRQTIDDATAEALAQMMSRELNADRLDDLAAMLTAAAGNVRLAIAENRGWRTCCPTKISERHEHGCVGPTAVN